MTQISSDFKTILPQEVQTENKTEIRFQYVDLVKFFDQQGFVVPKKIKYN